MNGSSRNFVPPDLETGIPVRTPRKIARKRPPRYISPWLTWLRTVPEDVSFLVYYWEGATIEKYLKELDRPYVKDSEGNQWRFWILPTPPILVPQSHLDEIRELAQYAKD